MCFSRVRTIFRRVVIVGGPCFVIAATGADVSADCVPTQAAHRPSLQKVTDANKTLATVRYKAGNDLFRKQDYEGALDLFRRSRELWPRGANTKNAAICLSELGRYPEALALFEEVLGHFSDEFTSEEIAAIGDVVADLRKKVLSVEVLESSGTFAIDDDSCGPLPRKEPVYILPGSHVLHVFRKEKNEVISQFSGRAGQRIRVQLPPPPPPPPPPPVKKNEGWFATIGAGPIFGFSTATFDETTKVEYTFGGLGHVKAGHLFDNGWSLALASGGWYSERNKGPTDKAVDFTVKSQNDRATYELRQQVQSIARYMGFLIGFEPRITLINRQLKFHARAGVGIIGLESRYAIEGTVRNGQATAPVNSDQPKQLAFFYPAYGAIDLGIVYRFEHIQIGLSLETFITFLQGPPLVSGRVQPRPGNRPCRGENETVTNFECIPALLTPAVASHRPGVTLIPQFVFGFAQ